MSLHSRPMPAPKKTLEDLISPIGTHLVVRPETNQTTKPSGSRSAEVDANAEPERLPEARAERAPADGTSRPWYRREPWLAVMLAGFVPLTAAIFAPDPARYALMGLTGLALIIGAAMLMRQGVFQPHPESEPSPK